MPRMTGGQALVKSLYMEGVRVIFGIPGVQTYEAMDALYDEPGIRFVTTRHEQAAAYMADGFSRAGGGVGTTLVVPGPGLLNASAAVGTAYASSSPILVVSGQIPRDAIGVGIGHLHEVDDQLEAIKPVTKWAGRALRADKIPKTVHEAFRYLKTGRPRPVEIEIPPDTLKEEADVDLIEPEEYEAASVSPADVQLAVNMLLASESPAILAGGGAVGGVASRALLELAEHLQAPVFTTGEGKGAISDRHYLASGGHGFRTEAIERRIADFDVILALGARLGRLDLSKANQLLHVDTDGSEEALSPEGTITIEGDVGRTLAEMALMVVDSTPPRPSRRAELERLWDARFEPSQHVEPQGSYVRAIRAAVPDDGIIVEGVTQIGYASHMLYPVYEPGTYFTSSYFGNLGYVYPTALGAKVARPDRAVVGISGDGGFLYNSQELATAVMYGINAVVIVFNDNAYGNVMRDQKLQYDGRVIGSQLRNPDFVKLAQAYGAVGVKAQGPDELEAALRVALEADAPTLIEVPVEMMPEPY